jgi:hypothetical protein
MNGESPTSASQVAETTSMHHNDQLLWREIMKIILIWDIYFIVKVQNITVRMLLSKAIQRGHFPNYLTPRNGT